MYYEDELTKEILREHSSLKKTLSIVFKKAQKRHIMEQRIIQEENKAIASLTDRLNRIEDAKKKKILKLKK